MLVEHTPLQWNPWGRNFAPSRLRKPFANCEAHQLRARTDVKFLHGALLMTIDSLWAARQLCTDFVARKTFADETQDFDFAL